MRPLSDLDVLSVRAWVCVFRICRSVYYDSKSCSTSNTKNFYLPFYPFPAIFFFVFVFPVLFPKWKWRSLFLEMEQFYTLHQLFFYETNASTATKSSHHTGQKKLWQHLRYGVYSVCNLPPCSASGNHH